MTEQEFAAIIESSKSQVLAAIEKHLGQNYWHAIDDVVQETYLRAFRSLQAGKFRQEAATSTWLYAIARNEALRMNSRLEREEKKHQKLADSRSREEFQPAENHEEQPGLGHILTSLPRRYLVIFTLYLRGYSEKQIASKLQIPRGTVKSRLHRGREMIQKLLHEKESYEKSKPC